MYSNKWTALILVVGSMVAAFVIGIMFGRHYSQDEAAYHRGVYDGVQSTIFQSNRLLGDVDSQYRLRYTPEDDTYHLVIKPQGDSK